MTKISIITPAYNSAKYIDKCIESVVNSNYDLNFIEHIIVDDGSTDDTAKICKAYAKQYKHIKFFSKNNGNWGSVINYVKHNKLATGQYVLILDSDDMVKPNAFKLVNLKADNSDVVIGNFSYWDGNKIKGLGLTYQFLFKSKLFKKTTNDYLNHIFPPHCTYVKTDIFYKTTKLIEKISYQDCIYFANVQTLSKTIKHIKKTLSLYWYNRDGNSVTSLFSEKQMKIWLGNLDYYEKNNLLTLFVTHLIFAPFNAIQYLEQNNTTFHFNDLELKLNGYAWWQKKYIKKIYNSKIKNLIKY